MCSVVMISEAPSNNVCPILVKPFVKPFHIFACIDFFVLCFQYRSVTYSTRRSADEFCCCQRAMAWICLATTSCELWTAVTINHTSRSLDALFMTYPSAPLNHVHVTPAMIGQASTPGHIQPKCIPRLSPTIPFALACV
jgi:hypothetical protein